MPDDLVDFTPDVRAKAQEIIKRYRVANTPFNPPMLGDVKDMLGAIVPATATNWPGGGLDPENGIIFAPAGNTFGVRTLVAPPAGYSDIRYVSGIAGRPFAEVWGLGTAARLMPASSTARTCRSGTPPAGSPPPPPVPGLNVDGLPISKPPYGLLAAVDLNRGELLWQTPHGDTPDNVRNHPALKGRTFRRPVSQELRVSDSSLPRRSSSWAIRRSRPRRGGHVAQCFAPTTRRRGRKSAPF